MTGSSAPPPPPPQENGSARSTRQALALRRDAILSRVLVVTAILAGIAYVPGMWAAYQEHLWGVMVADTLAYAAILVFAFVRRLPYDVRAGGFVGVTYLLGLVLLIQLGSLGAGTVWLAACPVLAAVFFRMRGALATLALISLTLLGLGFVIHLDPSLVGRQLPEARYALAGWLANAGTILFLSAVLSLSIASLVRWLEGTLAGSIQNAEELVRINRALEEEIAERKHLQEQLLQSQKMEALGTLAGGIAHDFNNLLVPILADTREVQARLPPGSRERDDLDEVVRSAGRARELVQQVLAFSRSGGRTRRPTVLDPVVEEVAALLRRTVPPGVDLTCRLEAGPAEVHANAVELHQVVMNLALNGFRAIDPDPGTLTISTRLDESEGVVVLEVADTGRGMSPQVMERAFDPFFTTRQPGEGTGLGLATVHGIVTGMGGTVELESREGEGTTVRISLPGLGLRGRERGADSPSSATEAGVPRSEDFVKEARAGTGPEGSTAEGVGNGENGTDRTHPGAGARIRPDAGAAPPPAGGTRARSDTVAGPTRHPPHDPSPGDTTGPPPRILVVDDEPSVRRVIERLLSREGYEVTAESDGRAALARLHSDARTVDLVITDHSMPHMTGIELAGRLREIRPELPIVLTSGFLDPSVLLRARAAGIVATVDKPYEQHDLLEAVRRALSGASQTKDPASGE